LSYLNDPDVRQGDSKKALYGGIAYSNDWFLAFLVFFMQADFRFLRGRPLSVIM